MKKVILVQGQYYLHRRPKESTNQCLEKENLTRLPNKRLLYKLKFYFHILAEKT